MDGQQQAVGIERVETHQATLSSAGGTESSDLCSQVRSDGGHGAVSASNIPLVSTAFESVTREARAIAIPGTNRSV